MSGQYILQQFLLKFGQLKSLRNAARLKQIVHWLSCDVAVSKTWHIHKNLHDKLTTYNQIIHHLQSNAVLVIP